MIGRDTVTRARLFDRLGYRRPVTLVVAPAGYGKTTLVVDWLEHTRHPYAWLSLDAYDDSLTAFISYVLAAVRALFPGACPETQALLNSASPLIASVLAHSLVNELEGLPQRFILVLDDYNSIQDLAVQVVMAEVLQYQPHTLELVLMTRFDPPLPLPALRARNRITEIRAEELRFSREESRVFLQEKSELLVDDAQAAALEAVTEGWAAGLRMVTLLMQQQGDAFEVALEPSESGRLAMEYLADEVLAKLPVALQRFLLKTAFMEQVCAPLCAVVLDGEMAADECQGHLDTLVTSNLFVFPLRGEVLWYRYHQLLRLVLQHRVERMLTVPERTALHLRAGRWLAADGQLDAALAHAVQAGDVQAVADLVRSHRHELINGGRWAQLETWRRIIPRDMIEQHPQLLVLDLWSLSHRALIAETGRCLAMVETLLPSAPMLPGEARLLRGELDAIRSQVLFWAGEMEQAIASGRRALDGAAPDSFYTRAVAWVFYVMSLETTGRAEAASAALDEALREGDLYRGSGYPTLVLTAACFVHWQRADMLRLEESANRMLALAGEYSQLESIAWARYWRGSDRYQQSDLVGAEEDFAAVVNSPYAHPLAYSQSVIGLASVYQAQGEFDRAYEIAEQGWRHFRGVDNPVAVARIEGFLAHLCFRQGKMDEALHWLSRPNRILPGSPMPTFHAAPIGRAAILLGLGSPEAQAEAAELLAELRAGVERLHNTRFLIEVLALQALALASVGEEEAALTLLERAVLLTAGGAIRALADLDFQIGPLLEQLARRGAARSQVMRIRRAALVFRPAAPATTGAHAEAGPEPAAPAAAAPAQARHRDLLESLTLREMDVLALLMERLSNKEIAQQLSITPGTVKHHVSNIFEKLHVTNRREAIVQARMMGLLPSGNPK